MGFKDVLSGQVALITGAGSEQGIGYACARALAELGAHVVITATTERINLRVSELTREGYSACGFICDLTDREATGNLIKGIEQAFGRIDILVNNAGMSMQGSPEKYASFYDLSDDDWDLSISRNLTTCFNVTRAVVMLMKQHQYGRIINISSVTGPLVSNPKEAAYSAAKAAMVGMSRSVALDVAPLGITINNVAPGWIKTASQTEEEQAAAEFTPFSRAGTADEVAHMVVALALPGSGYVTGQVIVVDGGNCLQEAKGP